MKGVSCLLLENSFDNCLGTVTLAIVRRPLLLQGIAGHEFRVREARIYTKRELALISYL